MRTKVDISFIDIIFLFLVCLILFKDFYIIYQHFFLLLSNSSSNSSYSTPEYANSTKR